MWEQELLAILGYTDEELDSWAACQTNVYKVAKARAAHRRAKAKETEQRRIVDQANLFKIMMQASSQQRKRKERQSSPSKAALPRPIIQSQRNVGRPTGKSSTSSTSTSVNPTMLEEDEGKALGDWGPRTWQFLQCFLNYIKSEVSFDERDNHKLRGKWPKLAYPPIIEPSNDPGNWLCVFEDCDN